MALSDKLESVFKTDDPAILPLAKMALETEGIAYFVKHSGKHDSLGWVMSQQPTNRPVVLEIMVTSDLAGRARDLLAELAKPAGPTPVFESEPPAIVLENVATGAAIGSISESQLQELTSRLQEDSPKQYRITDDTIDALQHAGVDASLLALLRSAADPGRRELVIRWVVR